MMLTAVGTLNQEFHMMFNNTFNVLDYGAIGNGYAEDTQAFLRAWNATCQSSISSPVLLVPSGKTFLLHPIQLTQDDCKYSKELTIQIDGDIVAPDDPREWKCINKRCDRWIQLDSFDGLTIQGSATIDPKGSNWWPCKLVGRQWASFCKVMPGAGFRISNSQNVRFRDLKFKNSPQMHVAIFQSSDVYVSNLTIHAPGNSPNTDGIHVQHGKNVFIDNSQIRTGDDCISIGTGTSRLFISNIECGPGHGISIGSLGKDGSYDTVQYVVVNNVTFRGSANGVRIKSWQGGNGYARNIIFRDIRVVDAQNPIIIDQFYCPHSQCATQNAAVAISGVTFERIYGTSSTRVAVKLDCSESVPCTHISLKDINLTSSSAPRSYNDMYLTSSSQLRSHHHHRDEYQLTSECKNVRGRFEGVVVPEVHCEGQF